MLPAAHLNEYLKRFLPLAGLKPSEIAKALKSPYLTLSGKENAYNLTKEDTQAISLFDKDDSIVRCPFTEFRFCASNGSTSVSGYVTRRPGHLMIVNILRHDGKLGHVMQVVYIQPGTDVFSGDLVCAGKIYRTSDLKDLTQELKEALEKKTTILSTDLTRNIKNLNARYLVEAMPAKEQENFFSYIGSNSYIDPRLGLGRFFVPDEVEYGAQLRQRRHCVLGLLDEQAVREISAKLTGVDTYVSEVAAAVVAGGDKIEFDTAEIKDPRTRQMVEAIPAHLQSDFFNAALQHEVARESRAGDASVSRGVQQARQRMEEILSKLDPSVAKKIALQMKDKTQEDLNVAERKHKKLTDQAVLLRGVTSFAEGLKPGWDRMEQIDMGTLNQTPSQDELFMGCYRNIAGICYEYLTPSNFMAQVTPRGIGKSVEWLQAREHYVVIHRHHEANRKGLVEGQVIVSDPSKNLTRMAHSRRAHTRLLKADRYTFAKGTRVPVRAHWCGPKEWQDNYSQTYKILVPTHP